MMLQRAASRDDQRPRYGRQVVNPITAFSLGVVCLVAQIVVNPMAVVLVLTCAASGLVSLAVPRLRSHWETADRLLGGLLCATVGALAILHVVALASLA